MNCPVCGCTQQHDVGRQLRQPVADEQLPDQPFDILAEPERTVTLGLGQLKRFRQSFEELGRFAEDVTGVPWEFLSTWDMEQWRAQHGLPCRDPLFRYWQLGGR